MVRRNRLATDARREVRKTFGRFLSVLVLSALAVAFLAGLRTTAPDMESTADRYFDEQGLMDGYVLSTMGITEEDLAALEALPEVDRVEGGRSVDAAVEDCVVSVNSMPQRLNRLNLKQGRLPQQEDECVTEQALLDALGLRLGDRLDLVTAEGETRLSRTSYTVVGVADSPLFAWVDRGTTSLGNGSVFAFVYVPMSNFDLDVYTVAYFTGVGLAQMDGYSDAYDSALQDLLTGMEVFAEERATLRDEQVRGEAQGGVDDARQELDDAKQELENAKQELADARQELEDARAEAERELAEAKQALEDARQELDDGWQEYEDGQTKLERELSRARRQLTQAKADLEQAQIDYDQGVADYEAGLKQYADGEETMKKYQRQYDEAYDRYERALAPYKNTPAYELAVKQASKQKQELDNAKAELDKGYAKLAQSKKDLEQAKQDLARAKQEIADGWADYEDGQAELTRKEANGRRDLADALAELERGEVEYTEAVEEYETKKAEAERELADAEAELKDGEAELADGEAKLEDGEAELEDGQSQVDSIETCQWYVLGRDTNIGFVNYSMDAERISNLSGLFPVIFFLVAALASLTTMTRMVEDQRIQIGSLKAMGFSRWAISKKYIGYAFWASLIGSLLGLVVGCTVIPGVTANAFRIMYSIPPLRLKPQPEVYVTAVAAAVVITTLAGLSACLSTLRATPAALMRPKAPKAGRRVLLERIGFFWRHLSFTWKVTMRNLFRYQKRFWMTVIGIGGCTALIVTGFGLHESLFSMLDKQFDEIYCYDAAAGVTEEMAEEDRLSLEAYLNGHGSVEDWMFCRQNTVKISNGGKGYSTTLYSVEDDGSLQKFIALRHREDGTPVSLSDGGLVITEKLSELLQVQVGDTVVLEGDRRLEVPVADITEQYLMHNAYLTAPLYESLYSQPATANAVLLDFVPGTDGAVEDTVAEQLMSMNGVVSYSRVATFRDRFTESMVAINYVVIVIIVAAAALAFVVLNNLANMNITERTRELATLKVLGFHNREVTAYLYRENVFLTLFGIALGLVLGRFLHNWVATTIEMEGVMCGRLAPPYAYVLAAGLTVVFSLIVNFFARLKLRRVDMVESLKTVE